MKKQSNKKVFIFIFFLVFAFIFLGYFLVDRFLLNSDNNIIDNNDKDDVETDEIKQNDNEDNGDNSTLEVNRNSIGDVLKYLGITVSENSSGACLNIIITDSNYKSNAKDIVSYYSDAYFTFNNILNRPSDNIYNSKECDNGSFDCYIISENDAKEFYNFYKFNGKITDYFKTSSNLDNEYIFMYNNTSKTCEYEIDHDTSQTMVGSTLVITDKQKVIEYDLSNENKKIKKTINKTVTYNIKKDSENNYYLDSVAVK